MSTPIRIMVREQTMDLTEEEAISLIRVLRRALEQRSLARSEKRRATFWAGGLTEEHPAVRVIPDDYQQD